MDGWALDALCAHLEAVTFGDINRLLANVPPGFMKLCADSTHILTPDGYRTHGDLQVGDSVFGPDGKPTRILHISEKSLADYDVKFSTHEVIKCNGDHLWTVFDRWARKWKTVETRWLAQAQPEKDRSRFFIPDTEPLQFPERDLALHPYFVGCWLGDGTYSKPNITHHVNDREHIAKLERLGYLVTTVHAQNNTRHSYFTGQGIIQAIRKLGLYKNKHIPDAYLTASLEQRCELLAGLIDTDGTVDQLRGRVTIGTTVPHLADQIERLVLSMGMRPYRTELAAPGYGDYRSDKTYFMIGFQPIMPLPTAIPRKEVDGRTFEHRRRAIVEVKRSEISEEGHCITVDRADGLYVVGRTNVVTHNSLATDVFWPAWEWGPMNMPHLRYVTFSYSASLTERDNGRFRDLLISREYQELYGDRFKLRKIGETRVTNDKMGWKLASSVGGVGTGERGDRVLLDDPHNVKEVESDTVRDETVRWFRESMSNRLNNDASAIVIIMQRLHEIDVSGTILAEGFDYCHLMIPMEYDEDRYPPDYQGTDIGWIDPRESLDELAWPERFSEAKVVTLKKELGPYAYAGQYQQSPVARGGGIFKRDWWHVWEPTDSKWPTFDYLVGSLDSAFTAKEENDPSGMTVWGIFKGTSGLPCAMLVKGWRKHLEMHGPVVERRSDETYRQWRKRSEPQWGLVEWVAETCRFRNPDGVVIGTVDRLIIEAKASGITAAQEIQRLYGDEGWLTELSDPRGDKVARAHSVVPIFANGQVWAPDRDWSDVIIDEMSVFPKGRYDDLTDSVTQALKHLRVNGLLQQREEIRVEDETRSRLRRKTAPLYPA